MSAHPEQVHTVDPLFRKSQQSKWARAAVLSLVASLLVVVGPGLTPAMASNPGGLTQNDGTCDLSTAQYLGDGSEGDPFQISDSDSLWEVTDCSTTGSVAAHFELIRDIDATSASGATLVGVKPIGTTGDETFISFSGVLDGNGFAVTNISISVAGGAGLFGHLEDAVIRDLTVSGSGIVTTATGTTRTLAAGSLTAYASGDTRIENVTSYVPVTTGGSPAGGLVGWADEQLTIMAVDNRSAVSGIVSVGGLVGYGNGTINVSFSTNRGEITGNEELGGLIGFSSFSAVIENSSNQAEVSGDFQVGGLIGQAQGTLSISLSTNSGEVSWLGAVGGESFGGLVGESVAVTTLSSVANTASVSGDLRTGGLVGISQQSLFIENSANFGSVETLATFGDASLGGLIGFVDTEAPIRIEGSHNHAVVTGNGAYVGGLAGYVRSVLDIQSSTNSLEIRGDDSVGGLVGLAEQQASITSSVNMGGVFGTRQVAGLLGQGVGYLFVADSTNDANVSGNGAYVGGLAGLSVDDAEIRSSMNSGNVSGDSEIGGLVGSGIRTVAIVDSQNSGSVSGTSNNVGGLVGQSVMAFTVDRSTNSNSVSGSSFVGGFAGFVVTTTAVTSSSNLGYVFGTSNTVGGFVGQAIGDASFADTQNLGSVSGSAFVGGAIGQAINSSTFIRTHNNASIYGSGNHVGGFIGQAIGVQNFSFSLNDGTVSGAMYTGGLVGEAIAQTKTFAVTQRASVIATGDFAGGMVGQAVNIEILQSRNTGVVSGSDSVGGIIGQALSTMTISDSIGSGNVSGGANVGGIAGVAFTPGTPGNFLQTGVVTGTSDVDGLIGTTSATVDASANYTSQTSRFKAATPAADLKKASTFAGFDFTNIWGFGSCTDNQGFPMLRVFSEISNYNAVACGYTPPAPQPEEPAPAPVLPPLPAIDQNNVQVTAGSEQLLTGLRFDLIRSASINGMAATLSALSATSVVLEIPNLEPGNYSLDLETSNGRISFQGLVNIQDPVTLVTAATSSSTMVTNLNPRSSWLNKTALAELEQIFTGQSAVTCIAYNDRPGVIARKKALSRAMHACRIADQLGIETRVFVYGKAPELADTVKILFR